MAKGRNVILELLNVNLELLTVNLELLANGPEFVRSPLKSGDVQPWTRQKGELTVGSPKVWRSNELRWSDELPDELRGGRLALDLGPLQGVADVATHVHLYARSAAQIRTKADGRVSATGPARTVFQSLHIEGRI